MLKVSQGFIFVTESVPNGLTSLEVAGCLTEMVERRRKFFTAMAWKKDISSNNHRNW